MELITLTMKTRGRGEREVEYQGVGRVEKTEKDGNIEETVVTDGVITTVAEFMTLPGIGNVTQKMLDFAVIGYNKFQRDAALDIDEFAGFIDASWDEKKVDAFKRSVRALAKVAEIETAEAAELVLNKMKKTPVAV